MTISALNIISIIVTVVLVASLVATYLHLRRQAEDAEGAIDIIELDELP